MGLTLLHNMIHQSLSDTFNSGEAVDNITLKINTETEFTDIYIWWINIYSKSVTFTDIGNQFLCLHTVGGHHGGQELSRVVNLKIKSPPGYKSVSCRV